MLASPSLWWSLGSGSSLAVVGWQLTTKSDIALTYSGYLAAILGAGIVLGGVLTAISATPTPTRLDGEQLRFKTQPTQRVAAVRSVIGMVIGILGIYGLIRTTLPVAYPAGAFFLGIAMYSVGIVQLWRNSLTKYYVTSGRVIVGYQLLKKKERTMPRDRIQGIELNKSPIERLISVGHVRLESAGDTGTSRIIARNINDPQKFVHAVQAT
ncbi:PH domain-containing protein [Haloarcula sp. CBA1122]|nr:PH domain-containing protein [Haloarcula sp. CBA1122]